MPKNKQINQGKADPPESLSPEDVSQENLSPESLSHEMERDSAPDQPEPYVIRLPAFVVDPGTEAGLGDVIKGLTTRLGVAPCAGCTQRAEKLNRMVRISGRRR